LSDCYLIIIPLIAIVRSVNLTDYYPLCSIEPSVARLQTQLSTVQLHRESWLQGFRWVHHLCSSSSRAG